MLKTVLLGLLALVGGFEKASYPDELVKSITLEDGVRVVINTTEIDPAKPTLLIIYALPNGNTIEQTMGLKLKPGMQGNPSAMDWHFDIQHIAAQTRKLRAIDAQENVAVALVEAPGKSWPTYRAKYPDHPARVKRIIDSIEACFAQRELHVAIVAHSGGGGFISAFINSCPAIPENVARIAYLDANYSYSDEEHHGDKLLAWLRADRGRELVVVAYDDRDVTLDGKKIVSDTGGTWRASHRMINRIAKEERFTIGQRGPFEEESAMHGQVEFFIHPNPEKKILHTAMIGEMNAYLEALTVGTELEKKWGTFGGPRAYAEFVEEASGETGANGARPSPLPSPLKGEGGEIPARQAASVGGRAFIERVAKLTPAEREAGTLSEILAGNVPTSTRTFKKVSVSAELSDGKRHSIDYEVSCDYLAIGSDDDHVRMPMRPQTAVAIAHAFGCELPTRKMVNDIWTAADVKVEPLPMTVDRPAPETFLAHSGMVDDQVDCEPRGSLIAGDEKDVVISPRVFEKPGRVLIYGWHWTTGKAIQPLTNVHQDYYMDYSHGIRLVRRAMTVDGKKITMEEALADPVLNALLSDEGVMKGPWYK
jgi:hypothetical protein